MKKTTYMVWLFTIAFIALTQKINAQDYYWSNNRKIPLAKDETTILVKADENSVTERNLQRGKSFKSIERINSKALLVRMKTSTKEMADEFSTYSNNTTTSFKSSSGEPMVPTGELLIMPKKGVNINRINRLVDRKLTISKEKYGCYTVLVEDFDKLLEFANQIYESGLVEYCHPNFIMKIEKFQTNDPIYPDQYYLNNTGQFGGAAGIDINAPQAWNISTGLHNVRVAVIDDGVENHVDMNGRVVQGFSPRNSNGFGAPIGNGDHGQACAGIIAATRNNNEGIAGIAGCTDIVPINIFLGGESSGNIASAIDWAWDQGDADVLSNSWGYQAQGTYHDNVAQAIQRARTLGRNGKGSIVVFSSGNSNGVFAGVTFPANVPGVITVGAINNDGNIWGYSSRGLEMDIVAPSGNTNLAGDVRTTDRPGNGGYNNGNYVNTFGGTSAACPQVAGAAALMLSVNRTLTESQVSSILKASAVEMGVGTFNNIFGHGRLDVEEALERSLPKITGPTDFCPSAVFSVDVPTGGNVIWSVSPFNSLNFNQGNASTTFTRNGSFSGNITLTATISSNCGSVTITKNTRVGAALEVNVPSFSTTPYVSATVDGGIGNYKWYWNNVLILNSPSESVILNLTCGGGSLRVEANSACGPLQAYRTIGISCGGGYFASVYPNPSSTDIFVSEKNQSRGSADSFEFSKNEVRLQLYDFTGNLVRELNIPPNSSEIKINVSGLKKGNYFLRIIANEIDEAHQIIVE